MLVKSSAVMLTIVITLIVVWAWQSYKHEHQLNPLITNNVVTHQDNHRNISRRWDNLDRLRNLSSTRKATQRRKETQ